MEFNIQTRISISLIDRNKIYSLFAHTILQLLLVTISEKSITISQMH